jgi:hypothetical protein
VLGQAIYMVAPKILTRLERVGLAKLIEDLLEEELELERSIAELRGKLPPQLGGELDRRLPRAVGSLGARFGRRYDPAGQAGAAAAALGGPIREPELRSQVERIAQDASRLRDVRAQLRLHRGMKHWLILHLASAGALAVLLVAHVVAMLRVLG